MVGSNDNHELSRRSILKTVGAGAIGTTLGAGAAGTAGADASAGHFHNPVEEPVVPDPSTIRTGDGTYYVFASNQNRNVDENERLVPIYRSDDLVNWEYRGEAFDTKPDWKDGYLWAPDIQYFNGEYYLYYSHSLWGDSDPGIGVATSSNIEGPYYDHGKLFRSSEVGVENSIDPVLHVEGGTPYLVWGSFHGIYGVELTGDGLGWIDGTQFHMAGDAYEGPYFLERDGYHYMVLSTGTCCQEHDSSYALEVGRADNFFGPYYNQHGVDLRDIHDKHGGGTRPQILSGNARFAGPGHNGLVQDDAGDWWCVYHAYDTTKPGSTSDGAWRRSLMIDPIHWIDGWPIVDNGTPSEQRYRPVIGSTGGGGGGPIADGTYEIQSVHNDNVLDVADWGTANGDDILQWPSAGGANQHWHVTHVGDGEYVIKNVHSGKYVSVEGGFTDDGANVWQWDWENNPDQRWRVEDLGGGEFRLTPTHSGKVMDLAGGSQSSDGDTVHQWSWNGGAWQRFRFNPV